ncbi:restriction endonuclease subunit S [uncultured Desulfovibrio sp.]|uniref:restriction endonuclease subunit S n=1 Tax=uncultured Desulfovibrio sp. TaxID=167968 RepID=UPI00260AEC96|nr:restriction endonuclease subunit S [uncultured Desulfovibrio sp.]
MRLIDVCEFIVDCPHSTSPDEGTGFPLIRTPNIGKGRLILENVHKVSEKVYHARTSRAVPQDDDLIFAREAPAGNIAIIKNGAKVCLGQRTVLIRPDRTKVFPDFLVYYMLAPQQQHNLLKFASGATVPHVNLPDIRNLHINLPSYSTQQRIAGILSAYDDLIENNQRQIQLLEEAAQRLYKEWFVDLRFPGHENTRIVDGVPEGWERRKIDDICNIVGGATPSTKIKENYEGGNILWATPTDITKNKDIVLLDTEKKITQQGLRSCAAKILPPYTILMTSRASIGFFAVCEKELCTNQGFISCIPHKKYMTFYLLYNLISRKEEIIGKSKGSTFLEISKSTFKNFEIIEPDMDTLYKFYSIIFPFIKKIEVTKNAIRHIEKTKKILLPKLISHK